ncbi:MAG: hypothetical protein AAGA15_13415 [Pseudomonadota bacterium]
MPEKRSPQAKTEAEAREDRLKKALKANMAKRKAQARARAAKEEDEDKEA